MFTDTDISAMRRELLDWYDREGRSLPWRIRPEDRVRGAQADPYAVWLSEIMLQQTTVPHATPYWLRFLELWPQVEDLAEAPRDRVMKEWAGLGYYARARNLHACAQAIAGQHAGQFPDTLDELKALPGIGDYTANAIRAAAFDKPASVVDGNVERVISRVYRLSTPLPKAKPEIKRIAARHADPDRPGDYAQAIMDLGAVICMPRNPVCDRCPWQDRCSGRAKGDAVRYPLKQAKAPKPVRRGIAWLVRRDDCIWLRRRPDEGLLGGMAEIPSTDWLDSAPDSNTAPFDADWRHEGEVKHVFTHFELRMDVRAAEAGPDWQPESGYWQSVDRLEDEALPSLMLKILKRGRLLRQA